MATTLEDALTVLRFASTTMMKRYQQLEELGYNNFLDMPDKSQALLVMVDEAGELLSPSGVKALSENTFIPTPDGGKLLKDLGIDDEVFDVFGKPTKVVNKYEPEEQDSYSMVIRKDSTNEIEEFISGKEHYWVAYFEHPDGEITGPSLVETGYLHDFKTNQDRYPEEDRVKVKFKRFVDAESVFL